MLQHLGDPLPLLASLAYPYNPSAAAICCKKSKVVKGEGWDMHTRFMDKSCTSWKLVQTCLPKTTVFHGMYKPYQVLCLPKTDHQLHQPTSWVDYQKTTSGTFQNAAEFFLFQSVAQRCGSHVSIEVW